MKIMSEVLLGEVAKERKETSKENKVRYPIVGLEHLISEEITLTAWEENKENSFTKIFRKGDVLFGRRRAYLKKAVVAPFDGICSGDITVIQALPDKILPELLPFIIQNDALFDFAIGKSAGSLSPRVKWENLKNFRFELPDLKEQSKLASLLWSIDSTKKTYQKLIQKTDELVKSQFMEQFEGYEKTRLGEIANITAGQSSPHDDEFSEEGTPFIKAGNLEDLKLLRISEQECNLVDEKTIKEKKLKLHNSGTVLVAKSGMSCLSGHIYSLKKAAYVVSHLACIQPIDMTSTTEYIRTFFMTVGTKSLIRDVSYPAIQLAQFAEMEIPDVPYKEQIRFASFVRQSDKSKFASDTEARDFRLLSNLIRNYDNMIVTDGN